MALIHGPASIDWRISCSCIGFFSPCEPMAWEGGSMPKPSRVTRMSSSRYRAEVCSTCGAALELGLLGKGLGQGRRNIQSCQSLFFSSSCHHSLSLSPHLLHPPLSPPPTISPCPTCGKHYGEFGRGMHVLNHNLCLKVLDSASPLSGNAVNVPP